MLLMLILVGYNFIRLIMVFSHHPVNGEKVEDLLPLIFIGLFMTGLFTFGYMYRWKKRR
jgi:hypothetical protein